ncbi:RNA 2'-phosphotransferase [Rhodovulum sulfidophilum]|uniref:RNA 2'-phosphotransferase n=1 Tax=Rhodovulum sulfidophilum TaxID=35806 RepID=UPI0009D6D298|nr:RNA 2'-phosphotransferase [Rhodovulum sulfidophilum]MBL3552991.1 RNA 2'-phosphotransferase [Rhodovulum sulfidophilum]
MGNVGTEETDDFNAFRKAVIPGRRQHVLLSSDQDNAITVGTRQGRPVVLRIDAAGMHSDGFVFWRADNGVWLTLSVPPQNTWFSEIPSTVLERVPSPSP